MLKTAVFLTVLKLLKTLSVVRGEPRRAGSRLSAGRRACGRHAATRGGVRAGARAGARDAARRGTPHVEVEMSERAKREGWVGESRDNNFSVNEILFKCHNY